MSIPPFSANDLFRASHLPLVPCSSSVRGDRIHRVIVDGREVVFDPTSGVQQAPGPQVFTVVIVPQGGGTWGRDLPAYHAATHDEAHRVAAVVAETLQCKVDIVDQYHNKDGYAWCAYAWYGTTCHALGRYSTVATTWYHAAHTSPATAGLTLLPDAAAQQAHGAWKLHQKAADFLKARIAALQAQTAALQAELDHHTAALVPCSTPPRTADVG